MKILHVINSLYPAGAENLVTNLANKQVKSNQVSIFTFYMEYDVFDEKLDKRIGFYPHKGQSYFSISKIRHLISLIKKHDLIHVHLFPPFYILGVLAPFFRKKKFIYTEHNTTNRRRQFLFRGLEKFIYGNYDHIICISQATEVSLKEWIGNKVNSSVINNFVDSGDIKSILPNKKKDLGFSSDSTLLVMVGRFNVQKDQDTILKTLKLLPNNYELVLIGIGERLNELKEMVLELDLSSRVHFMGSRKDVIGILKVCDYGILSSHWEGFGIAALEYIASDIIALGTNVDGLNEVIRDEECLFDVGNHIKLAEIILKFEGNTNLVKEIKEKQQAHLQQFEIDQAVKNHFDVYQNIK